MESSAQSWREKHKGEVEASSDGVVATSHRVGLAGSELPGGEARRFLGARPGAP